MILKTQRVGNKRPGGPTRGHLPRARLVELKGRVPGTWAAGGQPSENQWEEDAAPLQRRQVRAQGTSAALLGSGSPGVRSWPRHMEETAGNSGSVQGGESPRRQLRQGHRLCQSSRPAAGNTPAGLVGGCGSRRGWLGSRERRFHFIQRGLEPQERTLCQPRPRGSACYLCPSLCRSEDPCPLEPFQRARGYP